jgi:hypothetical protein
MSVVEWRNLTYKAKINGDVARMMLLPEIMVFLNILVVSVAASLLRLVWLYYRTFHPSTSLMAPFLLSDH